jgi:hypothetical protein
MWWTAMNSLNINISTVPHHAPDDVYLHRHENLKTHNKIFANLCKHSNNSLGSSVTKPMAYDTLFTFLCRVAHFMVRCA